MQGNVNLPEYSKLKEIVFGQIDFFQQKTVSEEPPDYIGTDETGKGDIFGPLVAAGVFVNEKTKPVLKKLGVKDSKELTDSAIWTLAKEIADVEGIVFKVKSLEPEEYNLLYKKHRNINIILDNLHSEIVEDLLPQTHCKTVITDKFHTKDIDIQAAFRNGDVNFIAVNKAEKFIGVAAASIIARAKMIQWFKQNRTLLGEFPKGSSTDTISFIERNANALKELDLNKYAKLHFKTWKKFFSGENS